MNHELGIFLLAVLCNIPVAIYALKKKSLRIPDGLLVAAIMGIILFMAHWFYWAAVIIFFASSSLLTKYKEHNQIKEEAMDYAEKGGTRDAIQVLANGGLPLLAAIYVIFVKGIWQIGLLNPLSIATFTAVATVTADTWATEIGVLSHKEPVSILNPFKNVPRGTSGGVSFRGFLATSIGSLLIAGSFIIAEIFEKGIGKEAIILALLIWIGGILGSITDSFLGATIQAQYQCPKCKKITEKRFHLKCGGVKTIHVKGIKIINNDVVNISAALIPAVIMYFITIWIKTA